jgi:hypothetical protein
MRNAGGYAFSFSPDGIHQECDTFTCAHCGGIVHVKSKCNPDDLGGMCRLCMKMICPQCVDLGCTPFEKRLEQVEKRDRILRSYGL